MPQTASESITPPPGLEPPRRDEIQHKARPSALRVRTPPQSRCSTSLTLGAIEYARLRSQSRPSASDRAASRGPRARALIDHPENDVVTRYDKPADQLSRHTQKRKSRSPRAKSSGPVRSRTPLVPPRTPPTVAAAVTMSVAQKRSPPPFCSSRSRRRPVCPLPLFPRRYRASGMVKDDYALISLRQLTGEETDLEQVRDDGKGPREPPTAPEPSRASPTR